MYALDALVETVSKGSATVVCDDKVHLLFTDRRKLLEVRGKLPKQTSKAVEPIRSTITEKKEQMVHAFPYSAFECFRAIVL